MKRILYGILIAFCVSSSGRADELMVEPGPNDSWVVTSRGDSYTIKHEVVPGQRYEVLRLKGSKGPSEGVLQFDRTSTGIVLDSVRGARHKPGTGHALQGVLLATFSDSGPIRGNSLKIT